MDFAPVEFGISEIDPFGNQITASITTRDEFIAGALFGVFITVIVAGILSS